MDFGSEPARSERGRCKRDRSEWHKNELDRSKWDRSEPDRSEWDRSESDWTKWDRSEPDRGKWDKSELDRSEWDRSQSDRSNWDRVEPDRSQLDRSKRDRSELDRSKWDRSEPDRSEWDRSEPDRSEWDRSEPDRIKWDRSKPDRCKWDRSEPDLCKSDRSEPDRSKWDRSKSDRSKWDRSKSDRSKWDRSKSDRSEWDRSEPDRSEWDRSEPDRSEWDRSEPDRSECDRSKLDRSKWDRSEPDRSEVCARRIQECWRSHQNRKVFQLLIKNVRSAQECLAPTLLRHVSPQEANLLKDPSLQCKVRIRFAGPQFPPVIVYKIFLTGGVGSYLSGKTLFQPSHQATAHTCRMMGNRKFIDLMLEDWIYWQGRPISHPAEVTCIQDYMQYSTHLDELPARAGGRENGWRPLTLTSLRNGGGTSAAHDRVRRDGPSKATVMNRSDRPIRSPVAPPSSAVSTPGPQTPKRRSARAWTLANRMRLLYTPPAGQRVKASSEKRTLSVSLMDKWTFSGVSDCEWEEEAELLCSWTNQLTLD